MSDRRGAKRRSSGPDPYPLAPTLGDLAQEHIGLFLWCNGCSRNAVIPAEDAIARFGRDRPVPAVRARCSSCGSRDVEPRPDWQSAPASPGVVTTHAGLSYDPADY